MVKRSVKKLIQEKEQELQINLSNNYKDLAREALEAYKKTIDDLKLDGQLKPKDYEAFYQVYRGYEQSMKGYHH